MEGSMFFRLWWWRHGRLEWQFPWPKRGNSTMSSLNQTVKLSFTLLTQENGTGFMGS
ncbi:hypothetical protein RHGRI_008412 [Rhododendron griersonianum]|uniref:Uncharacterized protein n=1 Tax=Rhododendron griersonianum TaxID=479676 RepID=A0AAV6L1G0_9ERIC|nr:hypothetical protein RHGRI_008412 [Rhododendron griersonianum]